MPCWSLASRPAAGAWCWWGPAEQLTSSRSDLPPKLREMRKLRQQLTQPAAEPQPARQPVLAVVGSASGTAQKQLAQLEDRGFTVVRLHPRLRRRTAGAYAAELAQVWQALAAGSSVAITVAAAEVDPSNAAGIVRALSAFAAQAAKESTADLILTGGETAREVLDAVGLHSLVPLAAVQHGAVLSRAEDGTLVGTKPGSFGDDLALVQLYDQIRERRGQSADAPANTLPSKTSEQSGADMTTEAASTTEQNALPYVAVTMGDGAGVGPEVVVAAVLDPQSNAECRPVVIGDALRLRQAADILGIEADIQTIENVEDAVFTPGRVNVIDLALLPEDLPWGQLSPVAGHAAYEYIRVASELAMAGKVQAICTAPLNKEALHAAGHIFPGHTELLAHLTGTEEVSMMLSTPKIRVIHVTTHIGLMDAIRKINPDLVERTIRRGHEALVRAGIAEPEDRRLRHQPARRRERPVRPGRGSREDRTRREGRAGGRHRRHGPAARGHAVLPGRPGRLRPGGGHVPRPGARPGEGAGHRGRREHHRGPAGDPHVRGPRHRL